MLEDTNSLDGAQMVLVLRKFLSKPKVGGGNKNKMVSTSLSENKSKLITKNFIFDNIEMYILSNFFYEKQ